MSLSPLEYIHHILDEIDFILTQISDMDYESFVRNPTVKRAFVRSLEIIGEDAVFSTRARAIEAIHEKAHEGVDEPRCPLVEVVEIHETQPK